MNRPTIYVTKMTPSIDIDYLLYGMEEEGIPSETRESTRKELISAAFEQAIKSPLGVGISVDEKKVVLHFKNLPEQEPLFVVTNEPESMMILGQNAARLVKCIPFKLDV
ncbi:glycerol dehydratase reactivase beta/small subunit family protein [Vagococcus hydrophili]|uniref:Propanediol dehydratase n=1 Tax=Vagococcus hydrophili TaxID=2714947 RepID=A0A6G8AQG2_9ENTE|nr:glycerol dehydratase reactivase beta/small subunit family protein [Vagococcus hydrophili]QIL47163.1 propanediol dehydratase [Vagococcus hydrophili]